MELEPLFQGLNALDTMTVIIFDEFPDMLLNLRNNARHPDDYATEVDNLTVWLRTLRQNNIGQNRYQFVFCGAINLRKWLGGIGLARRIADLESLRIPPLGEDEARVLIDGLIQSMGISVEPDALEFLVSRIKDGPAYYGQLIIKALRQKGQRQVTLIEATGIYNGLIQGDCDSLFQFSSRLDKYLDPEQRECSKAVLRILCDGAMDERGLHEAHFSGVMEFDRFQEVVERLIFEGYVLEDAADGGKLRFASPVLRDWWSRKGF
ncbi:MAG: hypothetical protein HQL03_05585 [Nitrospirae bacterium]|nr:hypothetical protein [Nitrospirota bacterium]